MALDPRALRTASNKQQFETLVYFMVVLFPRLLFNLSPTDAVRIQARPVDQPAVVAIQRRQFTDDTDSHRGRGHHTRTSR